MHQSVLRHVTAAAALKCREIIRSPLDLDLLKFAFGDSLLLHFAETDGITTVHFTHSGLWDEEAVRSHEGGWGRLFDSLERTLEAARR